MNKRKERKNNTDRMRGGITSSFHDLGLFPSSAKSSVRGGTGRFLRYFFSGVVLSVDAFSFELPSLASMVKRRLADCLHEALGNVARTPVSDVESVIPHRATGEPHWRAEGEYDSTSHSSVHS